MDMKTIQYTHVGSRTYLSSENIVVIKADFAYSEIFLADGRKVFVSTHLMKLQQRFGNNMVRVHRSYLLNPKFIIEFRQTSILTQLGFECPTSRRMRKNIEKINH